MADAENSEIGSAPCRFFNNSSKENNRERAFRYAISVEHLDSHADPCRRYGM